ncbi:MAG: hypothetical protein JWM40_637 [Frankiales bacterium]|nr:hypothetical protein [Frankiales bacterium]
MHLKGRSVKGQLSAGDPQICLLTCDFASADPRRPTACRANLNVGERTTT